MRITRAMTAFAWIIFSIQATAQITYEKGYFIDKSDQRIECYILNKDWVWSPGEINYKINLNSEESKLTPGNAKEFSVGGLRYVSADVLVDKSTEQLSKMTTVRNPEWSRMQVFLKVLSEGKASLFQYYKEDLERYYFRTEKIDSIRPLVFKRYYGPDGNLRSNLTFMNQLQLEVSCGELGSSVKRLKYSDESLVTYFQKYNRCMGVPEVSEERKKTGSSFDLNITSGLDVSSFRGVHYTRQTMDFDTELSVRIGLEAEFILPFNKNKWAIAIEPTYQSYKTTSPSEATYTSIEIPVGLRHYFYLNSKLRLFLNASAVFDFPQETTAKFSATRPLYLSDENRAICYALGAGVKYNRFGIAARYYTTRSVIDNYNAWLMELQKVSLIASVRLF